MCSRLGAASSANRNVLVLKSRSQSGSASVQRKGSDVDVLPIEITNPSLISSGEEHRVYLAS